MGERKVWENREILKCDLKEILPHKHYGRLPSTSHKTFHKTYLSDFSERNYYLGPNNELRPAQRVRAGKGKWGSDISGLQQEMGSEFPEGVASGGLSQLRGHSFAGPGMVVREEVERL